MSTLKTEKVKIPDYKTVLTKKAQKQLDKLSNDIAEIIFDSILELEINPRPKGSKKLKGRDGFRIRVGSYRIIYKIFDKELIIDVIAGGHRKDIY